MDAWAEQVPRHTPSEWRVAREAMSLVCNVTPRTQTQTSASVNTQKSRLTRGSGDGAENLGLRAAAAEQVPHPLPARRDRGFGMRGRGGGVLDSAWSVVEVAGLILETQWRLRRKSAQA